MKSLTKTILIILLVILLQSCAFDYYNRLPCFDLFDNTGLYLVHTDMHYTEGNMDYAILKGNAFAVDGRIITADHVIWQDEQSRVIPTPVGNYYTLSSKPMDPEHWIILDGQKIKLRLLKRYPESEIAVLIPEKPVPGLTFGLGDSDKLKIGTKLFALGYPRLTLRNILQGYVAAFSDELDSKEMTRKYHVPNNFMAVNMRITTGDSGSPVLAIRDGVPEVIGVITGYSATMGFMAKINGLK